MNVVIKNQSQYDLTKISRDELIKKFQDKLCGRVVSAYFFGSFARNEVHSYSDLDILLVIKNTEIDFIERAKAFSDLWDIFPAIDLLVYSQEEFERKNNTETQGFWPSMKKEFLKII
jgi:predicted nucleotidyltransferase